MNRWLVVAGAIAIQLALGVIYAWSAFTKGLQSETAFDFSRTQTQAIFSAGLASFGIVMILAGRLLQRYPPRHIALLGGLLLGLGYILGGLTGSSFTGKLVTIGIIGGAGIGMAYVVPIAVGVKWFPDRKGLLTGLAVAGFGFGAFLWILLASPPSILADGGLIQVGSALVMNPDTGVMETVNTYDVDNLNEVFTLYGMVLMVLVVAGSLVMVEPPKGWRPEGYTPPAAQEEAGSGRQGKVARESRQMLHDRQFWALWAMFAFGALAGLMVIGNIQNFAKDGVDGFTGHGFSKDQAADFAVIGAAVCLPIFNGLGRIVWGGVSDRIGRKRAFTFMFAAQGLMMFAFFWTTANQYLFYLVAALIGFNFGGNFALFPAATADHFGARNVGSNYGLLFTSYAVGGIIGPVLAGMVKDQGLAYTYAFVPAAVLCLVASGLSLGLRAPGSVKERATSQAGRLRFLKRFKPPRATHLFRTHH